MLKTRSLGTVWHPRPGMTICVQKVKYKWGWFFARNTLENGLGITVATWSFRIYVRMEIQ